MQRPIELPFESYPSVGRFGNWLRSGNDVVLLLDEDASPLDQDAATASPQSAAGAPSNGSAPPPDAGAAPPQGAGDAPPEGAGDGPPADAPPADAPPSGTEGELWGRGGLSRRKLSGIQHALNYVMGLRLPPDGFSNPPTRSALRSYQQQKGLVPHGQVDYATEVELANDIAESISTYEMEFGGDPCVEKCKQTSGCNQSNPHPQCLLNFAACITNCPDFVCPPRPDIEWGSKGKAVRDAQVHLNFWRATPRLTVDGDFRSKTDAAVRNFQRRRGLVVDGIVGPETWAALGC
jgi:peptidoglycan hydrolase-like protein with peptidoglycan-binding domain